MTHKDRLLEVVPLGSSPSLVVFCLTPPGYTSYAADVGRPRLEIREAGPGCEQSTSHACSVYRTLHVPLEAGSTVEVELWDDRFPTGLLFKSHLVVPNWDIYMVLFRPRAYEAQRWFGRNHLIEAGWASEYPPVARVLERAEPSHADGE